MINRYYHQKAREMFFSTIHKNWDLTPHQIELATRIGDWEVLMMFVAGMDALNRKGKAEQAAKEEQSSDQEQQQ